MKMNAKILAAVILFFCMSGCSQNKEAEQKPVSADTEITETADSAVGEEEAIEEPEDDTDSIIAEQLPSNTPDPAPFTGGMTVDENATFEVEEDTEVNIE